MSGGVLVGIATVCCIFGFVLNSMYVKRYGEPAIQWKPFVLQVVFLCGALSQFPGEGVSCWFLFWAAGAVISYAAGLWMCQEHARKQQAEQGDAIRAMAVQAILPIGSSLAFMMLTGMILFGFVWAH